MAQHHNGTGRPRLRKGEGRIVPIHIRLTVEEERLMRPIADARGMALAAWFREQARKAVGLP